VREEHFITHQPKNVSLRKYISHYYFHSSTGTSAKEFVYYPSLKNALTIYQNAKVTFGKNYSKVEPHKAQFIFLYSGIQNQLRKAYILPPFDKIGVVFQELGINHFVKDPLIEVCNQSVDKSFPYFGEDLIKACTNIYSEKRIESKVHLLDIFFESRFCDFREEVMKKSFELILHSPEKITVKKLSDTLHVSRRTLLRLFKKHLGCTVKDCLDIVFFRKSLNYYLLNSHPWSLTEVALKNNYYDQSQFISHFKKLTGVTPKLFFRNVKKVGNEDTFWTFQ